VIASAVARRPAVAVRISAVVARGRARVERLPNRAWTAAAAALLVVVPFAGVRLVIAAHGDASRFAVVGSDFADPSRTPHGLHVFPHSAGYDGQFFYRLAIDPGDLDVAEANGIRIDDVLRSGRIAYPAAAWVVGAGGQPTGVAWGLVLLNVAGLAALAAVGGVLAQRFGMHAVWGVFFAAYWGFIFTLSRDLSEILAATATLGAVVFLLDRRFAAAAVTFSIAALTREQALLTAGLLCLGACVGWRTAPSWSRRLVALLPVVIAAVVLLLWNAVVHWSTGEFPVTSSTSSNLGPPFVGMIEGMGDWLHEIRVGGFAARYSAMLNFLQLGALALLIALAIRGWVATRERVELWIALAGMSLFLVSLTQSVLGAPANFRTVYDVYLLAVILVFASRRYFTVLAIAVPTLWAASAALLAVRI